MNRIDKPRVRLVAQCVFSGAALLGFFLCGCAGHNGNTTAPQVDPAEQEDAFESATKRPPTAKTMYAMAVILAAQRKDSDCEWVLKRVIMEHPNFVPAYTELAELQVRQQRVDDAMATLNGGLTKAPDDAAMLNNLGMCWLVKGDYQKALGLFTQAAGIAPYNARYRSNIATALGMMGRMDESLAIFKQVLPAKEAEANVAILRSLVKKDTAVKVAEAK